MCMHTEMNNMEKNKNMNIENVDFNCREMLIELRKSTGMNKKEFCSYFGIPYRTLQAWELGCREMPEYLFRLMEYKVQMEKLEKK